MNSSTSYSEAEVDRGRLLAAEAAVAAPDRRHPARSVLAFIALSAAGIWLLGEGLGWLTMRYDFSEPKALESLAFRDQRFDVAYFGDSLTLEGLNASALDGLLHTRSYNFALGGASVLESELQLRHFVSRNPKPRLVALGLYLNKPSSAPYVRPTVYFALSPEHRTLAREKLLALTGRGLEDSFFAFNAVPAYRHRNSLDLLIREVASRKTRRPRFVQGQAQAFFTTVAGPVELGGAHRVDVPEDQLRSFLDFCAAQQIPVHIFEPPNHPGYSELSLGRAEALQRVRALVARYADVTFEASDEVPRVEYERTDWVNLNHLNAFGSEKYANVLAPRIRERVARGLQASRRH